MTDATSGVEEWRPIPGLKGEYEASSHGRVRSVKPGRAPYILAQNPLGGGGMYLRVITSLNGVSRNFEVHRVVAMAFHGECPFPGAHVRHLDGDAMNNTPDNLRWGSARDNAADMLRHNRHHNARKTLCIRNHPFTEENTIWRKPRREGGNPVRTCRRCKQERENRNYHRYGARRAPRSQHAHVVEP